MDVSKINWQPGDLIEIVKGHPYRPSWNLSTVVGGAVAGDGLHVRRRLDGLDGLIMFHQIAGGFRPLQPAAEPPAQATRAIKATTQLGRVLAALRGGETTLSGIRRAMDGRASETAISARIRELRKHGFDIRCKVWASVGQRYVTYTLHESFVPATSGAPSVP